MKPALVLLLVLPALTGCVDSPDFDGDAALQRVHDMVYLDDGSLRPRSPSSAGHDETANWLAEQLDQGDWNVRLDEFSGADYVELDKGIVTSYYEQSRYCNAPDDEELDALQFANVYATLPGPESGGHVVLAAHWDAKEDSHGGDGPIPAANDGASGVAVLMELQHAIEQSQITFPFTLTIAFFDGEDGFEDCHPLAGSLWAARNDQLGHVSQLILLDMVGDANAKFIRESQSVESDAALVDAIWDEAERRGLGDSFVTTQRPIVDDHVPFIEEGVPAVDIIDAGRSPGTFPPYWHTMEDTPDKLSATMLGNVGSLVLYVLTDPSVQPLLQH